MLLIEAVIVAREFSEPIIIRSFSPSFESIRTTLLSQLLEAIQGLAEAELKSELREISLLDKKIYLRRINNFTVAVITDGSESMEIIDRLVGRIAGLLSEYDPDELIMSDNLQKTISREIAGFVLLERLGIDVIKNIAESAKTLIDLSLKEGHIIKLKEVKPKTMKPKPKKIRILFGRKASLSDILSYFMNGDLNKTMERAMECFGDKNVGDFAKALYVKAGILLINRPFKVPGPPVEDVLSVAKSIEDDLLRRIMEEWVNTLWDTEALYRLRMFYIENKKELLERMKSSEEAEKIYLVLLLGIPDMRLISRTISVFHDKSSFVTSIAYSKQLMLQISSSNIENVEDWLKLHSLIRKVYDKFAGTTGGEFVALPYALSFAYIFQVRDLSESDLEMILNSVDDFWNNKARTIITQNNLLSSCHKSAIKVFSFYLPIIVRSILGHTDTPMIEKAMNDIETTLNNASNNFRSHRIINVMIYNIINSALLYIYSSYLYFLKKPSKNISDLIINAIDDEMMKALFVNRYHAIFYVTTLLGAILNTLILLPQSNMRDTLIGRILEVYSSLIDNIKVLGFLSFLVILPYRRALQILPENIRNNYAETFNTNLNTVPTAIRKMLGE